MAVEISPEPAFDVREALERAIEVELTVEGPPASAWWAAGIRESVGEEDQA